MGFYTDLAPMYDEIFPLSASCLTFMRGLALPVGGEVYDAGCATGSLAAELSSWGLKVLGVDLCPEMIGIALKRAEKRRLGKNRIRFECGDMTDPAFAGTIAFPLEGAFEYGNPLSGNSTPDAGPAIPRTAGQWKAGKEHGDLENETGKPGKNQEKSAASGGGIYDGRCLALCLGNTLPHLDQDKAFAFLRELHGTLRPGAYIILQLLNYSHPDIRPGYRFPKLRTETSVFRRRYEEAGAGKIRFVTQIQTPAGVAEDRSDLYPHSPTDVRDMLGDSGFKKIQYGSSWDAEGFDPALDRYLIAVARA